MKLIEKLTECQQLLRIGYDSATAGGLPWLKNLCREFELVCRDLHQYLEAMPHSVAGSSARLLDDSLLCAAQIVDCLAWLEQTVRTEADRQCVLSTCRQHFLDRVHHCMATMIASVRTHHSATVHIGTRYTEFDANFVTAIDYALELLEPLATFRTTDAGEAADPNTAAARSEALLTGQHIRSAVDSIVSHALTFAAIALPADRTALTTVCQTALHRCASFIHTIDPTSAAGATETAESSASSTRQLRAIALESSLYQLDALLNDCLLRLVSLVFGQLAEQRPLQRLQRLMRSAASQPAVDARIDAFDRLSDRLQQIGIFAAAFASTQADRTRIRSACASLEALDALLVPALLQSASSAGGGSAVAALESAILERHWQGEVERLQRTVQSIIDTDAFCGSLYDQLTVLIADQQKSRVDAGSSAGTTGAVNAWLDNCAVLLRHLDVNRVELELDADAEQCGAAPGQAVEQRRLLHADLALMLDECRAAAAACDAAEWRRVVKRLKIMQNVLKRFRATLADDKVPSALADQENEHSERLSSRQSRTVFASPPLLIEQPDPEQVAEAVLQPFNRSRSISAILYGHPRSNRKKHREEPSSKEPPATAIAAAEVDQDSLSRFYTGILPQPKKEQKSWRKRIMKKSSLRTTLFKRLPGPVLAARPNDCSTESEGSFDLNLSLDLHITDILEKITNLSDTLSNCR